MRLRSILLIVLIVAGCSRELQLPTYEVLLAEHNARVAALETLWCEYELFSWWRHEKGEKHFETANGVLVLSMPHQGALTVQKLGETQMWLGCNEESSWYFTTEEQRRCWVARNENLGEPCCEAFPFLVSPIELLNVISLGTLPRPEEGETTGEPLLAIDNERNAWVLITPYRFADLRLYLSMKDHLPIRAEVVSRGKRERILVTDLGDYARLSGPGPRIVVPTSITISSDLLEGEVEITVNSQATSPASGRINPKIFQFEAIKRTMRPDVITVLDENCPQPAIQRENGAEDLD